MDEDYYKKERIYVIGNDYNDALIQYKEMIMKEKPKMFYYYNKGWYSTVLEIINAKNEHIIFEGEPDQEESELLSFHSNIIFVYDSKDDTSFIDIQKK